MSNFTTIALLSTIGFAPLAQADSVFTNQAAWTAAALAAQPADAISTETFANNRITTPGMTIDSRWFWESGEAKGLGYLQNNAWDGYMIPTNGTQDVFSWGGKSLYAFGGDFSFYVTDGLSLSTGSDTGWSASDNSSGFWGVVSNTPFQQVVIEPGFVDARGNGEMAQQYTLSDVQWQDPNIAPTPEPATFTFMLVGLAFLMIGVWRKRAVRVKAVV